MGGILPLLLILRAPYSQNRHFCTRFLLVSRFFAPNSCVFGFFVV